MFLRIFAPLLRFNSNCVCNIHKLPRLAFYSNRTCFTGEKESIINKTRQIWTDTWSENEKKYYFEATENNTRNEEKLESHDTIESSPLFIKFIKLLEDASVNASMNLDDEKYSYLIYEGYDEIMSSSNKSTNTLATILRRIIDIRKLHLNPKRANKIASLIDKKFYEQTQKKSIFLHSDFKEALEISRLLCAIERGQISPLIKTFLMKSPVLINNMDVDDFCSYMYILLSHKKPVDSNLQAVIEMKFLQILPKLTAEQCAMICGAFMKLKINLKDVNIMENLVDFVCLNDELFKEKHCIGLSSIFTSLRHSIARLNKSDFDKLINKCKSYMDSLHVITASKICHLVVSYNSYDSDILEKGFSNLIKNLDEARIIDLERVFLSLAFFNHRVEASDEDWNKIENKIINLSEMYSDYAKFAHHFESLLRHLIQLRVYPKRLIDLIFGDKMQIRDGKFYSNIETYLMIHSALLIEAPEKYTNVLPQPVIKDIAKKFQETDLPLNSEFNRVVFEEWHDCLKSLFTGRIVTLKVLPFLHTPDMLIYDEANVTENSELELNGVSCVSILYKTCFSDFNSRRLKSFHALKLRLQAKLGFKLYCIPYFAKKLENSEELELYRVFEDRKWAYSNNYVLF